LYCVVTCICKLSRFRAVRHFADSSLVPCTSVRRIREASRVPSHTLVRSYCFPALLRASAALVVARVLACFAGASCSSLLHVHFARPEHAGSNNARQTPKASRENQCHGPSKQSETPRPREVRRGAIQAART
jgi:hypothetical protein